jgi:hypothetical protein
MIGYSFIKKITIAISIYSLLFVGFPLFSCAENISYAATYFPTDTYLPVADSTAKEGSIISFSQSSYFLSKTPYDQAIVGVITNSPAISQDITGPIPSYPILTTGQGFILVSTINGPIKKGDLLTSSTIPGVAMKATKTGYTIGGAIDDYTEKNSQKIGKIPVNLQIHYFTENDKLPTVLSDAVDNSKEITLTTFLKYFIAAGITISALVFVFIFITKTANKSIEALGRNPLSKMSIHASMMLNMIIAISILTTGFIMSVLILKV